MEEKMEMYQYIGLIIRAAGISRSSTIILAYLIYKLKISF